MKYIFLLWPHANARYQAETVNLASAELQLTLSRVAPEVVVLPGESPDLPSLILESPAPLPAPAIEALRRHSLLYALFEQRPDGALTFVAGRAPARVGADLPAILKYKGKTNEMFLQLLINAALYSGDYWMRAGEPLRLLDPMCGRGTSLFVAANMGWQAVGADVDQNDLKEAEKFFKRYLEYHRFKHAVTRESRTLPGKKSAQGCKFEFAATPEAFKQGPSTLTLFHLDATQTGAALERGAFHIVACDLPYGVRHDAQIAPGAPRGGNWLETLLTRALPAWKAALKPGGSVAVSFNAQTLRRDKLREMMAQAGLEPLSGGAYDSFAHWVEQAITRDIAIARKPD